MRRQGRPIASDDAYRGHASLPRVTAPDRISGDPVVRGGLRDLYGDVDCIQTSPRRSRAPAGTRVFTQATSSPEGIAVLAGTDKSCLATCPRARAAVRGDDRPRLEAPLTG